jgi:hypothetical protein
MTKHQIIHGPVDDGLFFEIFSDVEMEYDTTNASEMLDLYLSNPNAHSWTIERDKKKEGLMHIPFFEVPAPDDYLEVSCSDFENIISSSVDKLDRLDEGRLIEERKKFVEDIVQLVPCENLKTWQIYFLKWSYDFEGGTTPKGLIRYDYYKEFIFMNPALKKVFKAILGCD